jgi:hypothetical protein
MTDEWIKKIWCIYTMEFYLTIRNSDMWVESKWMQLEDIMLSKLVSERQRLHDFSHVEDRSERQT